LNKRYGLAEASNINNKLVKLKMIGAFACILIALTALSVCAMAQKNTQATGSKRDLIK
jgi:hypothetical protein